MANLENSATGAAAAAKTVLVVEDNLLNMKLFSAMLSSQGYNVLEATDGPGGLLLAQQTLPDLIIMDIQLPGMSGMDVTKNLKGAEATQHIPIIATTAFALRGDKEKFLESGCDAYMAKPIDISEFLALVESYISQAKSGLQAVGVG